jgi:hypothetical protein
MSSSRKDQRVPEREEEADLDSEEQSSGRHALHTKIIQNLESV